MYNLVIAEKPSVAQSIARVLRCTGRQDGYLEGNGYLVSWCVGHLVGLAQPEEYDGKYERWKKEDLPIIPRDWKYQVSTVTRKQFMVLKNLMNRKDVACVINACDAGREGELIFRLVYEKAGCRKPVKRLWISSLEDEAVKKGFDNLADGRDYNKLYEAALCRERADWLVGINATRFFSTVYGVTLNVGRVMTPTLALTVEREAQIRAFKPEDIFSVYLDTPAGKIVSRKFKDEAEAKAVWVKCMTAGEAIVRKAEKKDKEEKAPALFDLTSLQRTANKKLGYTAQQTLDYAQGLYEKKMISYPRTDSCYLTDDMEETLPELIGKAEKVCGYTATKEQEFHKLIDSKKVTDHHAIIITKSVLNTDLNMLLAGEVQILKMVAARLLEAVSTPCKYAGAVLECESAGEKFTAKGKTVTDPGWKAVVNDNDEKAADKEETVLSLSGDMSVGSMLKIIKGGVKSGKTVAPRSYTEDTLLSAMERSGSDETPDEAERKGLGTPATRAGIIEKLVRTGFIERRGDKKTKYLVPTLKGEKLISVIPEAIQSASMTAEWEQKLLKIEKDDYSSEQFMDEIAELINELVDTYEKYPVSFENERKQRRKRR